MPTKRSARDTDCAASAPAGRSSAAVAAVASPAPETRPTENAKAPLMRCPSPEMIVQATVLVPSGSSGAIVPVTVRPATTGLPVS